MRDKLEKVCDVLYKDDVETGIALLNELLPSLTKIIEQIDDADVQTYIVSSILTPMLQAMEDNNAIDLADIINYELLPFWRE